VTRHEYALVDVFTDRRFGGNQLAVFTDGRGIDGDTMQAVAKELLIAETTFVLPREKDGDHRVRIFTPATELPFAGHPTVGTAWVLSGGRNGTLKLELGVGTIGVTVKDGFVEMEQPLPTFGPELETADVHPKLVAALGVETVTGDPPTQVVSCGNRFLFAPMELRDVQDLVLNAEALGSLLREVDAMGLYAFTVLDTVRPDSHVHGRMFAPGVGIAEDPATGSAAGPLGSYLVRHGLAHPGQTIVAEQGFEIGRPSLLHIRVDGSRDKITGVHVGGNVVNVGGGWMDL
jgi:trans-2,3-dihydro-3-hydroxyanthranilate isomerase